MRRNLPRPRRDNHSLVFFATFDYNSEGGKGISHHSLWCAFYATLIPLYGPLQSNEDMTI